MHETHRRVLGYGAGALVVGALTWFGFLRTVPPDVGTLVSGAEVQMRMAASLPQRDANGDRVEARATLLAESRKFLDRAEALDPEHPEVHEAQAYLAYLQGDPVTAAQRYARAAELDGVDEATRRLFLLNEVRMRRIAGQETSALERLAAIDLAPARRPQDADLAIEKAQLLESRGEAEAAIALAAEVGRGDAIEPMARLAAGRLLERHARYPAAEAAYRKAGEADPSGVYLTARLKMRRGQAEEGVGLLERALATDPARVRVLVDEDREAWVGAVGEARLERLLGAAGAAASPGR